MPPVGQFVSVSAGAYYACGVKTDSTVVCWGANADGRASPPVGQFASVSAGWDHTCGVMTGGSVTCWGFDGGGQASPPVGLFASVSAGRGHTCGIMTDGSVTCWGWDKFGQASPPGGQFASISAGWYHTCGVMTDGSVTCWGWDKFGQASSPNGQLVSVSAGSLHTCGVMIDGSIDCWGSDEFGQASPPEGRFVTASAGEDHTCGVKTDGAVACWGSDSDGQASPPGGEYTTVSAGAYLTCALRTDGSITCWGLGDFGQASPPGGKFIAVSAGASHTCGVRTEGTLDCWGSDNYGQASPPGGKFAAVSAGRGYTCGVRTDGSVVCWGADWDGRASPPAGQFAYVSAGFKHTCGVRTDGSVACWGHSEDGWITPPSYGEFISVSAGWNHTCGVRTDGSLACWGSTVWGVASPPEGQFASVDAGDTYNCGVRTDGSVVCWGYDNDGSENTSPPRGEFASVSAAYRHTCGVRTDFSIACWGRDSEGQASPIGGQFASVSAGNTHTCGVRIGGLVACWGRGEFDQASPTSTPTASPAKIVGTVVVSGYWSDGTANVEVTTSLPGEDVQQITVTCSQRDEMASACPRQEIVWPASASGSSAETLIVRLRMGESYVLKFEYDGNEEIVGVHVPERILGVERDVWECFSDMSNVGTVWAGSHGFGCGGWYGRTIKRWDQSVPVRVWANPAGDPRYIRILGEVLEELSPILNLEFQWVTTEAGATFVAHLGIDRSQADHIDLGCNGCIATWDEDDDVIHSARFIVWRIHRAERQIKRSILREALRYLIRTKNRHPDQTSVTSSYRVVDETRLHRMEQELFKLHSNPLIRPGMTMDEVGELVVLRDELIDRPAPALLTPLQMLEEAYVKLQSTGSAEYAVSVRSAKCGEQLGWTDYKIANYGFYAPRWIQIDDGSARYYVLEHGTELWRQDSEGWREIRWGELGQGSILNRYRELSPHSALINIFRAYDDVEVEMVGHSGGELILMAKFASQTLTYPPTEVVIVLDEQSYEIREYVIKWSSTEGCGARELHAKDGRYGIDFEFPGAIWDTSRTLSSCSPETLGPIAGTIMRKGVLPGSCGADPTRNLRLYHFRLDSPRSAVNISIDRGDVTLRLLEDESGDYYRFKRISSVLPAGDYTIEITTFDTRVEGSFELEIGATPLAGKVVSVSSGAGFTCALDADGVPFCWGINPNGQLSPPNGEKFSAISSGWVHTCALRSDGSAVCWGNDYSGESSPPAGERFTAIAAGWGHTCAIQLSGAVLCWGGNESGQSSLPDDGAFIAISVGWKYSCALRADGSPVCWGTGRYQRGQSQPPSAERFTTISSHSGGDHTCALREDGSPVCWGDNRHGESSPPEGERFTAISSGGNHTCALRADDSPVCWGDNRYGESSPPEGQRFTAISSGHTHTCGVTQEGQVLCWGDNKGGAASPPG